MPAATELHFSVTVDLTPGEESTTVTEHGRVVSPSRQRELLARAMSVMLQVSDRDADGDVDLHARLS